MSPGVLIFWPVKVLSQNNYDVVLTSADWANRNGDAPADVKFIDSTGCAATILSGVAHTKISSLTGVKTNGVVVIGDAKEFLSQPSNVEQLKQFVSTGGNVLLLHPQSALMKVVPDEVTGYKAKQGEIVTTHVPESPVFSGIEPLDLAWFQSEDRSLPEACSGVYQVAADKDITSLAKQCDIHGYLNHPSDIDKYQGAPLVEIHLGKGRLIASELNLAAERTDPIPRRLLINIIDYLAFDVR